MNNLLLNIEIQDFINKNLYSDPVTLLFKGTPFKSVDTKAIIQQIEAKNKCRTKLPTWFNTANIIYPNKLNIEQSSSEISARYKANLVKGASLIDLSGGFGVDSYFFSKKIAQVMHCELDSDLSQIVNHNYSVLGTDNIECIADNGIDVLKRLDQPFDWIYIDPSRRDMQKNKVFKLTDCSPNVKTFQGLFLKYAKQVMIKTSPLLDISATLKELNAVKAIHIVAIDNDVKELLWVLERNYGGSCQVYTTNIRKTDHQCFNFEYAEALTSIANYDNPTNFLYEPNAAILKSGAFNHLSKALSLHKLHRHSHLYTSEELIAFPGRRFKIEDVIPFNKKQFGKSGIKKANVTVRNFPLSVHEIRKKLGIKDGGTVYLFFTTDQSGSKIIINCSKVT